MADFAGQIATPESELVRRHYRGFLIVCRAANRNVRLILSPDWPSVSNFRQTIVFASLQDALNGAKAIVDQVLAATEPRLEQRPPRDDDASRPGEGSPDVWSLGGRSQREPV